MIDSLGKNVRAVCTQLFLTTRLNKHTLNLQCNPKIVIQLNSNPSSASDEAIPRKQWGRGFAIVTPLGRRIGVVIQVDAVAHPC